MNAAIRLRFGLDADPWAQLRVDTSDAASAAGLVKSAATAQTMVSIVGPRGAGKTTAVRRALADAGAHVVEVLRLDRERVHLGDVAMALVYGLSDERPRHSGEARAAQARRLLGQAGPRVVLVVDDAHLLHPSTLRGLKRLRELAWRGRAPLLGIVLVGQADRTAAVPEVGLRTSVVAFAGLTTSEAEQAIRSACGAVVDAAAAAVLAQSADARNWLDLQRLVDRALLEAAARGAGAVSAETAAAVADPAAGSSLRSVDAPLSDTDVSQALEQLETRPDDRPEPTRTRRRSPDRDRHP